MNELYAKVWNQKKLAFPENLFSQVSQRNDIPQIEYSISTANTNNKYGSTYFIMKSLFTMQINTNKLSSCSDG